MKTFKEYISELSAERISNFTNRTHDSYNMSKRKNTEHYFNSGGKYDKKLTDLTKKRLRQFKAGSKAYGKKIRDENI